MNDLSEHCLCDHCSGQDCQVFTEEEQEQNQKEHDAAIREEYKNALHKVICDLYNNGFKNPLITFEAAVSYLEDPTFPGHPEKQRVKSARSGRQEKGDEING